MELIELKRELSKMLLDRYDEEVFITDGGKGRVINRAGTLHYQLNDDAYDELETLLDIECWMEKNEPYLTEHELSLKSEVNRHICILLTKEEI